MLASAAGREEGDGVVMHPREVAGKGKQDGGTGDQLSSPPACPDPRHHYLLLPPSPAAYAPRYFKK